MVTMTCNACGASIRTPHADEAISWDQAHGEWCKP